MAQRENWPTIQWWVDTSTDAPDSGSYSGLGARLLNWGSQRGRQYELDQVQAGTANLDVDNQDGELDPANTASAHFPRVDAYRPAHIEATWPPAGEPGATSYMLFAGFVERWPQRWERSGKYGLVRPVMVDALAMLTGELQTVYRQEVLADQPFAYYPLDERSGSRTFANTTGTPFDAAGVVDSPNGAGTVTAGADGIVTGDEDATCTTFSGASGSGLNIVGSVIELAAPTRNGPLVDNSTSQEWAVELWFRVDGTLTDSGDLFSQSARTTIGTAPDIFLNLLTTGAIMFWPASGGGSSTTTNTFADGQPHHIVFTYAANGRDWVLYVDGVVEESDTNAGSQFPFSLPFPGWSRIGGLLAYTAADEFLGHGATVSVAHFALYQHELSAARVAAHFQAGLTAFAGDLSGARAGRILDYAGWPSISADRGRDLDAGNSALAGAVLAGKSPLQALQEVAESENGQLFADASPSPGGGAARVVFRQRDARYNQAVAHVFGDGPGELPYEGDLAFDFDPTLLFPRVELEGADGLVVVAVDQAAVVRYRRHPQTLRRQMALANPAELIDAANYLLGRYSTPRLRVAQLTIRPSANPALLWPVALGIEIGTRVQVVRRPPEAPAITFDGVVEAVSHRVTESTWDTTLLMSPADLETYWQLDHAVFSQLDQGFRISY